MISSKHSMISSKHRLLRRALSARFRAAGTRNLHASFRVTLRSQWQRSSACALYLMVMTEGTRPAHTHAVGSGMLGSEGFARRRRAVCAGGVWKSEGANVEGDCRNILSGRQVSFNFKSDRDRTVANRLIQKATRLSATAFLTSSRLSSSAQFPLHHLPSMSATEFVFAFAAHTSGLGKGFAMPSRTRESATPSLLWDPSAPMREREGGGGCRRTSV